MKLGEAGKPPPAARRILEMGMAIRAINYRDENDVNAEPTKPLVIEGLIRDVPLKDAIADLVDNSIDGARRVRGIQRFDSLWVKISFSPTSFVIADNCGGIDLEIAKNFAFRIGRESPEKEMKQKGLRVRHSVGQFGVGMKRALFKIGREFQVKSRSASHTFSITVNVDTWKDEPGWTFRFDEGSVKRVKDVPAERGTEIRVTHLRPDVVKQFRNSKEFIRDLELELGEAEQFALQRGLEITIDKRKVEARVPALRVGKRVQAGVKKWKDPSGVEVKLYVGLDDAGRANKHFAGWTVFCNGRRVVRAGQDDAFGWGDLELPAYHAQYDRFRGFALLESDEPSLLPWNTSKTGIDSEHPMWRNVRQRMIRMMRPVVQYLDDYKTKPKSSALFSYLQHQPLVALDKMKPSPFAAPNLAPSIRVDELIQITYSRKAADVEKVMRIADVTTPKQVGEVTFDYYLAVNGPDR